MCGYFFLTFDVQITVVAAWGLKQMLFEFTDGLEGDQLGGCRYHHHNMSMNG